MKADHLKVALVDPSLFTVPYDAKLVNALRGLGHQVIVYGEARGPEDEPAELAGLRPVFYPELLSHRTQRWPHQVLRLAKGVLHWRAMQRLIEELAQSRPDVIHVQWAPLPIIDRLFLPELRKVAPVVLTVHDSCPFNGTAGWIQNMGATRIMSEVDAVIVHTEAARDRLISYGVAANRVARIPHGLLNDITPVAPRTRQDSDVVQFLLFGKLKRYKGADLLIEAFRRLPPDIRGRVRVQIVGKPYMDIEPLRQAAQDLEPSVCIDPRFVTDEEMSDILARADVIVFPYREIDVSGVLMAALRYARPILASKIGCFAELLIDGHHGALIPPDDVSALSAAMARLCVDEKGRAAMGAAVAKLGEAIPSWDDIARSTTNLYRSVRSREQNQHSMIQETSLVR